MIPSGALMPVMKINAVPAVSTPPLEAKFRFRDQPDNSPA
jgi:hypothetical protein